MRLAKGPFAHPIFLLAFCGISPPSGVVKVGKGTEGRPGRFPYWVIALLVVTVVISSAVIYSLPALMTSTEFHGFVLDEKGRPIANATVSAVEGSVRSSSEGSYSLSARYNGPFDIQANAEGHWVQKIRINDIGTTHILNFTLLNDIQTTVATGLAFVTFNATQVQSVLFGWDEGTDASMQATVEDFDPNSSAMSMTFDSSVPRGLFSSVGSGIGLLRSSVVTVSGSYGNVPGQIINCYVTKVTSEDVRYGQIPEYLNRSAATSTVSVTNGYQQFNDPKQNMQLPSSLGVAVNVDILGQACNTTLPVTWGAIAPCMHLVFHMEGGAQTDFKLLIEDGWIVHMWQV